MDSMTKWLIKTFAEKDKTKYGELSSYTGIACNILLFVIKGMVALLSGSVSILSDAFNNLSDCLSNLLSLAGYKVSRKPADPEHPFGHGRAEYIVSLIIVAVIFVVGMQLLQSGVRKILEPSELHVTPWMMVILVLTVLVKLWMYRFNRELSAETGNMILAASAQDSRNDALTTSGTILALVLSRTAGNLPLDGIAAVCIALFILYSGFQLAAEIAGHILGTPIDQKQAEEILTILRQDPNVYGAHDLLLHDYGNGKILGSAHIEIPADMPFKDAHKIADRLENTIRDLHGIDLTLHMDPYEEESQHKEVYELILKTLREYGKDITAHDLQIYGPAGERTAAFDVLLPYALEDKQEEIRTQLQSILTNQAGIAKISVVFDHSYIGETER